MFPARYRRSELDPVLPRDPDRGDTDGGDLIAIFDPGDERLAGGNPSFQDCATTVAGTCGQHLLGKAAPIEVTDGEGDLGAPEVHSEDYPSSHPPSR